MPYGTMEVTAFLGVWKDCNEDGYLGFGEIGLTGRDRKAQIVFSFGSDCAERAAVERGNVILEEQEELEECGG